MVRGIRERHKKKVRNNKSNQLKKSKMSDKVFAKGFFFNKGENSPSYVIGGLSINTKEAVEFLNENSKNGKIKLSIKESKGGKYYLELDTYVSKTQAVNANEDVDNPDLPF
jgi:hypothetical protein